MASHGPISHNFGSTLIRSRTTLTLGAFVGVVLVRHYMTALSDSGERILGKHFVREINGEGRSFAFNARYLHGATMHLNERLDEIKPDACTLDSA